MYDCIGVRDLFSGVRFCANVPLCRKYGVLMFCAFWFECALDGSVTHRKSVVYHHSIYNNARAHKFLKS